MKKQNIYVISALTYSAIIIIFLTQVVIVNLLSVADYGAYATLIAIVSMIEAPLIARGSELALKKAGEAWHNNQKDDAVAIMRHIQRSEKILYWLVFCLIIPLAYLLAFITEVKALPLIILSLSMPMQIGYSSYKSFLTIINNVHLQSVVELLFALITFVLSYICVKLSGFAGLIFSIVFMAFVKTQASKYFYSSELKKRHVENNSEYIYDIDRKEYNLRSLNSMFKIFTQNGLLQVDIIILGVLQRPEIVAIYKVGKSLAGLPTKVSIPVWKYLYPSLVKSVNTNNVKSRRATIVKGSLIVLSLFTLIYVGSFYCGERMIQILYGSEYLESFLIFMILLIGYGLFYAVNGWFKIWVALIDKMTIGSMYYLITFVMIAGLSYFFSGDLLNLSISISVLMVVMTCYSYFIGLKNDDGD